jgi:hypothetical protein
LGEITEDSDAVSDEEIEPEQADCDLRRNMQNVKRRLRLLRRRNNELNLHGHEAEQRIRALGRRHILVIVVAIVLALVQAAVIIDSQFPPRY